MKQVQMPRGTTEQEDAILGPEGQIRVDTSRNELRLHDGVTVGGHRIPNERSIQAMLSQGQNSAVGRLQIFATIAELAAAVPSPTTVALCLESGVEAWFVWNTGPGDQTSIPSAVSGSWKRLDSGVTAVMLLWRAGFVNLLVDAVPPSEDEETTIWIEDAVVKLWDGSGYVPATPALFCAMLAAIGGYSTESFILPDRLQAAAVIVADSNSANAAGWHYGTETTVNRPADVTFNLQVYVRDSDNIMQVAYETAGDRVWRRRKTAGSWGAWALAESLIGVLATSKIPNLDTAKITTGIFDVLRIPDLAMSKITGLSSALAGVKTEAAPPGAVMAFAMSSSPGGWLKADGSVVSRATYAALFSAIGTTYGAGDGSTTFKLPDLRGEFIRGWDNSRGVDTGRVFGSSQADQNKQHSHTGTANSAGAHTHTGSTASAGEHTHSAVKTTSAFGNAGNNIMVNDGAATGTVTIPSAGAHTHAVTVNSGGAHTHSLTINNDGGNEARPRNIALLYCIKY